MENVMAGPFVLYQIKVWWDKWNLLLLIYFWNLSVYESALLFWSYSHHLTLPHLIVPWEISLNCIEKEGRLEAFFKGG